MNIHYEPKPVKVHPYTEKRRAASAAAGKKARQWANDRTLVGKFMENIAYTGDCIVWTGGTNDAGYGIVSVKKNHYRAHRVAYELQFGPIAEGLVLDHLCRNPCCVNPAHLEAVTDKVNIHRGEAKQIWEARAAKTHCKHGHLLDELNTRHSNSAYPHYRACKTCHYYTKKGLRLMRRFGYEPRPL